MLEPCDGKLSRTVLRGEWSRKAPDLPDISKKMILEILDMVMGTSFFIIFITSLNP